MPPSQRWFTKGISQRRASFSIASRAERFVPTNSTLPPSATTLFTKFAASEYIGCVFSRLMMWILFRSPKMKGAIFGFQKRVWCPKWTPASSICRIDTPDIKVLLGGLSLRAARVVIRGLLFRRRGPRHPSHPLFRPVRRDLVERLRESFKKVTLPKKAALYTIPPPPKPSLTKARRVSSLVIRHT